MLFAGRWPTDSRRLRENEDVVFLHTGGAPALFACQASSASEPKLRRYAPERIQFQTASNLNRF
jgi:hypothetical protein